MPEVICNTSPLQYLHQLNRLSLLSDLVERIIVPPAVLRELEAGRAAGVDLPEVGGLKWVTVREPISIRALPLVQDLGPGETAVLLLALEAADAIMVLDDLLARRVAGSLGLRFTGTLGLLLDAKKSGLIQAVRPVVDQLETLRFRLDPHTREAVLKMAGEV